MKTSLSGVEGTRVKTQQQYDIAGNRLCLNCKAPTQDQEHCERCNTRLRKQGAYKYTQEFLADALGIPDNHNIYHIEYNHNRGLLYIYCTGDDMKPIPEGGEIWELAPPNWSKETEEACKT